MARILIVEDSPDQALAIASLLGAEGFETETAEDGIVALSALGRERPDVVVTDLRLPRLDGLELVGKIREQYPGLPVILMTAYGSGEIAMKALQLGAASYVPKRLVQDELVDVVEQIVSLTETARERDRMFARLTETELRFVLRNDRSLVPPLVNHLQESAALRAYTTDETTRMQIGLAVKEALLNAIIHGNLEVDSKLREESSTDYLRLIDTRRETSPYSERLVHLTAKFMPTQFVITVSDEGSGFDISQIPDPTDPENILRSSGRGLFLIGSFMDEMFHNDTGNQITLIKRIEPNDEWS